MKISDIRLEMELNGVDEADIEQTISLYQKKGLSLEKLDEELISRGYSSMFSVDYDAYDDYDSYDEWDEEFSSIEKFPHKREYV